MDLSILNLAAIMRSENAVFIVGVPRSGTSLLYRTLQLHSSFRPRRCAAQVDLTESHVFMDPSVLYQHDPPSGSRSPPYLFMLSDQFRYERFRASISLVEFYHRAVSDVRFAGRLAARGPGARALWWRVTLSHWIVRSYFYHAKCARGVKRLLEKTPGQVFRLPELRATFPCASIIFMYRHPIDVYSSLKRRMRAHRSAHPGEPVPHWLQVQPAAFSKRYQKTITLGFGAHSDNPESVHLVDYEALVRRPAEMVRSLCSFLGEPFEEQCVWQHQTTLSRDPVEALLKGAIVERTKDWSDHISVAEAQFIEHDLCAVMERLDYPTYTV